MSKPDKDFMVLDSKGKAKRFISEALAEMEQDKEATMLIVKKLADKAARYSEASSELLQYKMQYLALMEKYEAAGKGGIPLAGFPGISSRISTFTPEEMKGDTANMIRIAGLVKELEKQVDTLEDQFKLSLKKASSEGWELMKQVGTARAYIAQLLEAAESPYDAGFLGTTADQ